MSPSICINTPESFAILAKRIFEILRVPHWTDSAFSLIGSPSHFQHAEPSASSPVPPHELHATNSTGGNTGIGAMHFSASNGLKTYAVFFGANPFSGTLSIDGTRTAIRPFVAHVNPLCVNGLCNPTGMSSVPQNVWSSSMVIISLVSRDADGLFR